MQSRDTARSRSTSLTQTGMVQAAPDSSLDPHVTGSAGFDQFLPLSFFSSHSLLSNNVQSILAELVTEPGNEPQCQGSEDKKSTSPGSSSMHFT